MLTLSLATECTYTGSYIRIWRWRTILHVVTFCSQSRWIRHKKCKHLIWLSAPQTYRQVLVELMAVDCSLGQRMSCIPTVAGRSLLVLGSNNNDNHRKSVGSESSIASQPKPVPRPHCLILLHCDIYTLLAEPNMVDKSYSTQIGSVGLSY